MTKEPCSYCGEHHHYREVANMVCDNVRTLYPLWDSKAELKEAAKIAENYFTEEIKLLKGDLIYKNTETQLIYGKLYQEERSHATTKYELAEAKKLIQSLRHKRNMEF